jgi:signal transduction histidine kinase
LSGLSVYALADLVVGWTFLGCALLVWWRGRDRVPALLLGVTGATWFLGNLAGLPGILGSLAAAATFLHRGPLVQLVLTVPNGRPRSRVVLGAVVVGYVVAVVPQLARSEGVALMMAAGLVAVTWYEHRWMIDAVPVTLLAVALSGPALARLTLSVDAAGPTLLGYDACMLSLAAVLTTRLVRLPSADVADLVVGLSVAPSESLRDALARTVGDPTLQVAFVTGDGYVDAHGSPVDLDHADGRAVTPLMRDGRTIGFISHDPAVLTDPELVEAVATAAALTSANARLQAEVERQSAEVRASRRRLVRAGIEEGRRLEADLWSGPGARLDRIAATLASLPDTASAPGLVGVARRQVDLTRADLRDLARGLHPLAVRTSGLAGAISDLAENAPLPVTVEVDVRELPDEVAATAYFVCAEGLTNIVRHARAGTAAVRVVASMGEVRICVTDDGAGGADPTGSGLRGLADRVQALGGDLSVTSGAAGTALVARLPLAPA